MRAQQDHEHRLFKKGPKIMNNRILWDCHMHSSFSADSDTPMENMIRQSIRCGLSGICFTEHLDPDYAPTPDELCFSLDLAAYREALSALREAFQDKIQVLFGLEYGLQTHLEENFREVLAGNTFDFVIGSSHVVHGRDPYYPDFFQGRQESACYLEYFESILENLSVTAEMDVYGHLDYIVRYGPGKNREYSYDRYRDILDEILRTLIRKNVGLELNTGGYHYGLGEPNPCTAILKRYHDLGGEIITVGADAHTPDKIACVFDKAANVLRECGFKYYTVFKKRKPEFIRL